MKTTKFVWWKSLLALSAIALTVAIFVYAGWVIGVCSLIAMGNIMQHWEKILTFCVLSILSVSGGFVFSGLCQLIFTGYVWPAVHHPAYIIAYFIGAIYSLSVCLDEERQKPYIWLWRKSKLCFRKLRYLKILA